MAMPLRELQQQMLTLVEQNRLLNAEVVSVNQKLHYLDNDRQVKGEKIRDLETANVKLLSMGGGGGAADKPSLNLINTKTMAPQM